MVFIYFLEEERLLKQLPTEECNDFKSIAVVYGLGLAAFYISSYLPDYSSFSFCFAAAMAVVANREMALSTGIFLNLLPTLTSFPIRAAKRMPSAHGCPSFAYTLQGDLEKFLY